MIGTRLVSVSDTVQRVTLEIGDFRPVVFNSSSTPVYIGFHPSVDETTGYAIFPGKTIKLPTGYTSFYCVSAEAANIYIGCQNLTVRTVANNDVCINPITLLAGYEFESDLTDSIDSYDLTGVNTPTYATGVIGNALSVASASTQYAYSSSHPFNFDEPFEIHFMAYRATTVNGGLVGVWNPTGDQRGWRITVVSSQFRIEATTDGTLATNTILATSNFGNISNTTWYYIIAYYTGEHLVISVNGVANFVNFTNLFASSAEFWVGRNEAGYWNGRIDNILIFPRVLTYTEREFVRNSNSGKTPAEVIAYESCYSSTDYVLAPLTVAAYRFQDNPNDSSSAALNLTEVNTPTYVTGVHGQSSALDAASSQHFTKTPGTPWLFSGDFLICGYIRHTTNSSNRGICSIYDATGNQRSWLFRIASTKLALVLSSDGSTETTFTTARAVVNNVWQYVMAWRVSGDVGISIGAYAEDLGTFSDPLFSSSAILRIGTEASGNPFPGNIDELVFLSGNFSQYLGWIRNDGFGRSVNDILTYVGN